MLTNRLWSTTRLIAASALCMGALAATAQTANPLKIGVIGPFTGPSSDFGVQMLQGIQLATEEVNAVGGYMGRPFELVIKDDQGNPDAGLKGSQELAAAGVVATLGFCNTGVAQKSLEVFQTAKLPLIIPCATGSPLTAKYPAPESYVFRTSARDAIQAPYVVEDIIRRGWSRVAIFADTTGYGDAGLKDVEAALAAKNLKAVHVARFGLGVKDLRDELKAARDAGADVVFSYTVGVENAVIANGRKDLNWKVPQVGAWPLSFPFFINGAKDAAEGAMMAQTFIAEPSNERRAAFLSAYKRKFKQTLTVPMAAAQGYHRTGGQGRTGKHLTRVLRRGGHLRAPLQHQRQGRHHQQHAGHGQGQQRCGHFCAQRRRQTKRRGQAQEVGAGVCAKPLKTARESATLWFRFLKLSRKRR